MSTDKLIDDDPFGTCLNCISPMIPTSSNVDDFVKIIRVKEDRSIQSSSRRKSSSRLLSRFKREPGNYTDIPHTMPYDNFLPRPTSIEFESLTPAAPSTITEQRDILSELKMPDNHIQPVETLIKESDPDERQKKSAILEHTDENKPVIGEENKAVVQEHVEENKTTHDNSEQKTSTSNNTEKPILSDSTDKSEPVQSNPDDKTSTHQEAPDTIKRETSVIEVQHNDVKEDSSKDDTNRDNKDILEYTNSKTEHTFSSEQITNLEKRLTLLENKFDEINKLISQFVNVNVSKPPEVVDPKPVVSDNSYTPYIYDSKFITVDNHSTLNNNTLQLKVTLASLIENNENNRVFPFGNEIINVKYPKQILILRFQNDKVNGTVQGVLQLEADKYVINIDQDSYNIDGNKVNFSEIELPVTYLLDSDLLV